MRQYLYTFIVTCIFQICVFLKTIFHGLRDFFLHAHALFTYWILIFFFQMGGRSHPQGHLHQQLFQQLVLFLQQEPCHIHHTRKECLYLMGLHQQLLIQHICHHLFLQATTPTLQYHILSKVSPAISSVAFPESRMSFVLWCTSLATLVYYLHY